MRLKRKCVTLYKHCWSHSHFRLGGSSIEVYLCWKITFRSTHCVKKWGRVVWQSVRIWWVRMGENELEKRADVMKSDSSGGAEGKDTSLLWKWKQPKQYKHPTVLFTSPSFLFFLEIAHFFFYFKVPITDLFFLPPPVTICLNSPPVA